MLKLDYLEYAPSPNRSQRIGGTRPTYLIVHSMAGTYQGTKSWFLNPKSKVSAHFLVSKKGDLLKMVDPQMAAWHVKNFNSKSIGIEFEDMDIKSPLNCLTNPQWCTPAQLKAGAELAATLMRNYNIPIEHVIGHNDEMLRVLGNDHSDPGPHFPWDEFRKQIKGLLTDGKSGK